MGLDNDKPTQMPVMGGQRSEEELVMEKLLKRSSLQKQTDRTGILGKIQMWESESTSARSEYQSRWADAMRQVKGIWNPNELEKSKVRKRSKIFFRKTWGFIWRLLATVYQSFLKDRERVQIEGRGPEDVKDRAEVLQIMADYRVDKMENEDDLFLQHLWGAKNIFELGWSAAKFWWDPDSDGPKFEVIPNEQVWPDFAPRKAKMRYIMFDSYLTVEEMVAMGLDNIGLADPQTPPVSALSAARHQNTATQLTATTTTEYPSPDKVQDTDKLGVPHARYLVRETFYRRYVNGKWEIWKAVTNGSKVVFKEPEKSVYKRIPAVLGLCLFEAHKLIGEGFPDVLQGPQDSINHLLNARKDNIHLVMNRGHFVSRFANVDIASLMNSRPGAVTLGDDVSPNAIRERATQDVTQSAYVEAGQDEGMMSELAGVTPGKMGMERTQKATVAQINLSESNAKVDLFMAILANTWYRDFYTQLVWMIQEFETSKKIFQIANRTLEVRRGQALGTSDIKRVDDFDADIRIRIGPGQVGEAQTIQRIMMAWDKAMQSNQGMIQLLSTGVIGSAGSVKLFDPTKFAELLLPKFGVKNVQDFFVNVQGVDNPAGGATGFPSPPGGAEAGLLDGIQTPTGAEGL